MGIIQETCYLLGCDECRSCVGEHEDEGYVVHFGADTEALDWAADHGWTITTDGHTRCPRCTTRALCALHGHDWDLWQPCHCKGAVPAHRVHGCGLFRYCLRDGCPAWADATLAELPTTDHR